jgi:hypothetical protein
LATERLRSLHAPCCLSHRPNFGKLLAPRAPARLSTLGRWKIVQFCFTFLAINTLLGLGPKPKASTPFTNLQIYAHFHDRFSAYLSSPDGILRCTLFPGV